MIRAPDETEQKKFGAIVAVDGETLVVNAPGDTENGKKSGAVYVYRFDTDTDRFEFDAKLLPSDGAEGDAAAYTDISGRFVAIGAKKHDHDGMKDSGSVYVFTRGENDIFIEEAQLLPEELQAGDALGNQLALDGNTLLVAARGTNEARGAAYAYRRTGGQWKPYGQYGNVILPTEELLANDEFARRINFRGKTAVINKHGPNRHSTNTTGGVYIFKDTGRGFEELQGLFPDETGFDSFGQGAIDISSDETTVVVGAYKTDSDGEYEGVVYEYTLSESDGLYYQTAKIMPQDENEDYRFGQDVALRGNLLLVLGETANEEGDTGLVYLFAQKSKGQEWVQQTTLIPSENSPLSTDGFGSSLAIMDDHTVVIGRRYSKTSDDLARGGSANVIKLC